MIARAVIVVGLAAALLVPAGASAEEAVVTEPALPPAPAADRPTPPPASSGGSRSVPEILVSTGIRGMIVPSVGFEPYATNDVLLQMSIDAGLVFWRRGNAALSASVEWDAGGKSATTRGDELDLFVHRIALPLEVKWRPVERVGLFARVAPGADRFLASDATAPSRFARNWAFGLDASAGASVMFVKAKRAEFWFTAEFGYAFATAAKMVLQDQQNPDDVPRNFGATSLPDLKLGGGLARLGVGVGF